MCPTEPPPTLREQAVEAAAVGLHDALCPRRDHRCIYQDGHLILAETSVAAVWPFAERAALHRAEKALRAESAKWEAAALDPHGGPATSARFNVRAETCRAAADLVASLRPEELT